MPGTFAIGTFAHTQRLKERLTIQTETETDQGGGAVTIAYADGATLRGRVRPMKGREYLEARQVIAGTPYEITLRYPLPAGSALTASSRLLWHARTGDVVLHLQEPPSLMEDGSYYSFIAARKEGE